MHWLQNNRVRASQLTLTFAAITLKYVCSRHNFRDIFPGKCAEALTLKLIRVDDWTLCFS